MEQNKALSRLLKKARDDKKVGLRVVSDATGLTPSTISRMENGKTDRNVDAAKLRDLAEYYESVTYTDLMRAAGFLEENELVVSDDIFDEHASDCTARFAI